jgi:magnesium transporter
VSQFGIHPLTQEDIVTIGQRPKAEEFDDYVYIVIKMLSYRDDMDQVKSEQISIVLGSNFLITFQETSGDVLAPVRERIEMECWLGSSTKNGRRKKC